MIFVLVAKYCGIPKFKTGKKHTKEQIRKITNNELQFYKTKQKTANRKASAKILHSVVAF
jgi:hypothetical protein